MIKRRFYKLEHNDKDEGSDSSSSSSSDSEPEAEAEAEEEEVVGPHAEEEVLEANEANEANEEKHSSPSSGSGYESEDSSEKELEYDSSDDDDEGTRSSGRGNAETLKTRSKKLAKENSSEADYFILKCKSVYKCRICPRIVCLTEESLRSHLNSKRHARSEKLLKEGRLKFMLNSDGEIEEDQETHAERYARTMTIAQDSSDKKKKNKGRQRQKQRHRLKRKKMGEAPDKAKAKELAKSPSKKRRKDRD